MSITVLHAGVQTTVQDLGRPGSQHLGVPVGGAMDHLAHRVAALLVGNAPEQAALECPIGGLSVQFSTPALVALAGRDVIATLDGTPVPAWRPIRVAAGSRLSVLRGPRVTVAVAGGIAVPVVLDGRGTMLRAGFGGWHGRALQRGDVLPLGTPSARAVALLEQLALEGRGPASWGAGPSLLPPYSASPRVRFIPGPEFPLLTDGSRAALLGDSFRIGSESDRMGFRLAGHTLALTMTRELLSSGVTAGTIQLPPGGAPIILMADRQTTGGYPRLGDVIAVDLPLLAQLGAGETVRFAPTTIGEAHAAFRARERDLRTAAHAFALRSGGTV
jgi:antagonist of KipI